MPFDGSIRKICCCGCQLAACPRSDARTYDSVHEFHIAFFSLPRSRSPHSSAPLFHMNEPLWLCRGLAKWQMRELSALSRCCRGACPPAPAEKRKQDKTQGRHCHIAAPALSGPRDGIFFPVPQSTRMCDSLCIGGLMWQQQTSQGALVPPPRCPRAHLLAHPPPLGTS